MQLIDSHIHLDFKAFDADRARLLKEAKAQDITKFVVPATSRASWQRISDLSEIDRTILPCYGIHPYFIDAHSEHDVALLEQWIEAHYTVAIGECGLDYFLENLDPAKQSFFFKAQLALAANQHLPVILHARKAVEAVILELKNAKLSQGIVHSFNGSLVQAQRLIDMGFKLGFGGAITYPRASRLRRLVKHLPLEAMCIETDAPDQPGNNANNDRNEPIGLIEVLNTIAELRDESTEVIANITTQNCCDALNI